ncbi:MAG: hypothetical protein ABEJ79_07760 [Halolamina sp.]
MDRISALRNVEDALRAFEDGEADLEATERRVRSVLQTYATEFESERRRPYRASGDEVVDGRVVVAPDAETAAERVADAVDDGQEAEFDVRPL